MINRARVHASGVNPLDIKFRRGKAAYAQQPLPAVLGLDLAGIVEGIGSGNTVFGPGDEVHGMVGGVGGQQCTLAEFVAVDADYSRASPRTFGRVRLRRFR
jgi:NADPH2:quinone reductase